MTILKCLQKIIFYLVEIIQWLEWFFQWNPLNFSFAYNYFNRLIFFSCGCTTSTSTKKNVFFFGRTSVTSRQFRRFHILFCFAFSLMRCISYHCEHLKYKAFLKLKITRFNCFICNGTLRIAKHKIINGTVLFCAHKFVNSSELKTITMANVQM